MVCRASATSCTRGRRAPPGTPGRRHARLLPETTNKTNLCNVNYMTLRCMAIKYIALYCRPVSSCLSLLPDVKCPPPPPANPTANSLAQLLQLCQQLHACSDDELASQLHQLAYAQPNLLVQPVRLLLHSSQYLRQQLGAPEAATSTPALPTSSLVLLSPRECEVLILLAQGHTMPRIAEKLFISPATVNNHCARMREKLGLRGRNALLKYANGIKDK